MSKIQFPKETTIYDLYHPNHGRVRGYKSDFVKIDPRMARGVTELFSARRKTYLGWRRLT